MVLLVKPALFQPLHLLFHIPEYARDPVDHAVEVVSQFSDIAFVAMLAHVLANLAPAHPVQRPFQKVLPVCAALDLRAPLQDVRILAVAEVLCRMTFQKRHAQWPPWPMNLAAG